MPGMMCCIKADCLCVLEVTQVYGKLGSGVIDRITIPCCMWHGNGALHCKEVQQFVLQNVFAGGRLHIPCQQMIVLYRAGTEIACASKFLGGCHKHCGFVLRAELHAIGLDVTEIS